jgi:hypothetical protein
MNSTRCGFIPLDQDACPGDVDECAHLGHPDQCRETGGTVVTVQFRSADDRAQNDS